MEKLNLVELLKDCPKGMELDCTVYDNCTLEIVFEGCLYPIQIQTPEGLINLTKYGSMSQCTHSKCVIFPKGKTTWEGFVPPCKFKDGDVCYIKTEEFEHIFIFKVSKDYNYILKYANSSEKHLYTDKSPVCTTDCVKEIRYATEEEKQKLFDAIKANGYKWNAETKTLEKLPKFRVGNRIKKKEGEKIAIVERVYKNYYDIRFDIDGGIGAFTIDLQYEWELVPNKFDITTLKAFESRVLVRDYDNQIWIPTFWGKRLEDDSNCSYLTTNGCYKYCIPYEDNEHLLGTSDDCDPFFKNWEK